MSTQSPLFLLSDQYVLPRLTIGHCRGSIEHSDPHLYSSLIGPLEKASFPTLFIQKQFSQQEERLAQPLTCAGHMTVIFCINFPFEILLLLHKSPNRIQGSSKAQNTHNSQVPCSCALKSAPVWMPKDQKLPVSGCSSPGPH